MDDTLTIAEAAERLCLSGSRVHQMLGDGDLDGPLLPAGRQRHAAGAGRVFVASLERLLASRSRRSGHSLRQRRADEAGGRVADALAAVRDLKVQLDVARDLLEGEREQRRQLIDVTSTLVKQLKTSVDDADRLNSLAEGYSSALGRLLDEPDSV